MSREFYADVCAAFPGKGQDGKTMYLKIGTAFKDERGQIAIKLDTLPLPNTSWAGWLNLFEKKDRPAYAGGGSKHTPLGEVPDDDIPF